jgi:hypothetical protein
VVNAPHYHVHRLDVQGDEHKPVDSFSVEKTAVRPSFRSRLKAGLVAEKEALVDDAEMVFAGEGSQMNGVMMRSHRQAEVESLADGGVRQCR